jgi:hypothetical protein
MPVNWAIGLQQGNAGDSFATAFQQGQVNNRQSMARSAMAALVANPKNERALQALASVDPAAAQQFQQQQAETVKQQLAQHQDSILKGAEILRQFQPKDQASYSAALSAAQQAGIDVSQVPQQYNPEYVQGVIHIADALKPQASDNMKYIPLQPGGSVARVNPQTGQVEMVVQANPGNMQAGAPATGGPPPGHIEDGYRFKGGNPADPNAWEQVGGPSPSGSATFP